MTPEARKVRSLDPSEVTVELWLSCWSEWFPGERIEATVVHDDYMLAPFLRAHGRRRLVSVTRFEAQEWTLRHPSQVRYLRRVWQKAVTVGLLSENVWDRVEKPRGRRAPRTAPSRRQLDEIVTRAQARGGWWVEFADMIELAAFTGARLGGLASLRRSAVDLDAGRVTVTEKGSKTRTVALTPRARGALARQLERRSTAVGDALLFVSPLRRPLDRNKVGEAWREVRGDFGGPFHSLKHFAATWLLARGLSREDVAVQLGHLDAAGRPYTRLVERVYGHPSHEDAFERIAAATALTAGRRASA